MYNYSPVPLVAQEIQSFFLRVIATHFPDQSLSILHQFQLEYAKLIQRIIPNLECLELILLVEKDDDDDHEVEYSGADLIDMVRDRLFPSEVPMPMGAWEGWEVEEGGGEMPGGGGGIPDGRMPGVLSQAFGGQLPADSPVLTRQDGVVNS